MSFDVITAAIAFWALTDHDAQSVVATFAIAREAIGRKHTLSLLPYSGAYWLQNRYCC